MSPFEGPDQITIGNGQGFYINSSALASFSSPFNSSVSFPQVFFEFHPSYCVVKSQISKEVLLQGKVGQDGLYHFPNLLHPPRKLAPATVSVHTPVNPTNLSFVSVNRMLNSSFVNIASSSDDSCSIWHSRLGHPSSEILKHVLKLCNISPINKTDLDFCSYCCIGKSHKLPSSPSNSVYSNPFELVLTDLWGPAPYVSDQGFKYYVTFADAHTRFSWLYLLKAKFEILTIFKQFQTMVQTQFNFPIKPIQSDWGGKYRPFTKYLANLGIVHCLICTHTHHQNWVVERKQKHIIGMTLTMLSQAS